MFGELAQSWVTADTAPPAAKCDPSRRGGKHASVQSQASPRLAGNLPNLPSDTKSHRPHSSPPTDRTDPETIENAGIINDVATPASTAYDSKTYPNA